MLVSGLVFFGWFLHSLVAVAHSESYASVVAVGFLSESALMDGQLTQRNGDGL